MGYPQLSSNKPSGQALTKQPCLAARPVATITAVGLKNLPQFGRDNGYEKTRVSPAKIREIVVEIS